MDIYKKRGKAINRLAKELLRVKIGDKIPPINELEKILEVSRGTVQNAIKYIIENDAIKVQKRGHQGTLIKDIDYKKLQQIAKINKIQGVMPLPYSKKYQGIATSLYEYFSEYDINISYSRGARNRINLIKDEIYHFAICSKYTALKAIQDDSSLIILADFKKHSYLEKHILLSTKEVKSIDGLRVGIDETSPDQTYLVKKVTEKAKNISYIPMKTYQTISALANDLIDIGVWNYDDIAKADGKGIIVTEIDNKINLDDLNSAVIISKKGLCGIDGIVDETIVDLTLRIQRDVIDDKIIPIY